MTLILFSRVCFNAIHTVNLNRLLRRPLFAYIVRALLNRSLVCLYAGDKFAQSEKGLYLLKPCTWKKAIRKKNATVKSMHWFRLYIFALYVGLLIVTSVDTVRIYYILSVLYLPPSLPPPHTPPVSPPPTVPPYAPPEIPPPDHPPPPFYPVPYTYDLEDGLTYRKCGENFQCSAYNSFSNCCPSDAGLFQDCCFGSGRHGDVCGSTCSTGCTILLDSSCVCANKTASVILIGGTMDGWLSGEEIRTLGTCDGPNPINNVKCANYASVMQVEGNQLVCRTPLISSPPPVAAPAPSMATPPSPAISPAPSPKPPPTPSSSSTELFNTLTQPQVLIPLIIGSVILSVLILLLFSYCNTERAQAVATVINSIRGNNQERVVVQPERQTAPSKPTAPVAQQAFAQQSFAQQPFAQQSFSQQSFAQQPFAQQTQQW